MNRMTAQNDEFGDDDPRNDFLEVCAHGKGFDVPCFECCPEDDDGCDD